MHNSVLCIFYKKKKKYPQKQNTHTEPKYLKILIQDNNYRATVILTIIITILKYKTYNCWILHIKKSTYIIVMTIYLLILLHYLCYAMCSLHFSMHLNLSKTKWWRKLLSLYLFHNILQNG